MATVSFTKEMKLNKKETERLVKILETEQKDTYVVKTPAPKETSIEDIKKAYGIK